MGSRLSSVVMRPLALIRFVWFGFFSFLVLKNDIQWAWVELGLERC